ncbi:MAG TPA: AMP-binding protein, partial [Candidatus Bathyarchaeia archaeon]|nr:AMP-binding protein [Candidatus Bathyarchaeia archaeon]
ALPSQDVAAFFYTSGTTAQPKAVMLTHQNLLSNVDAIHKTGLVFEDDVVVSILPLHHTYAFTTTLLCPLLLGMTIAYPRSMASVDLLACMKQTCTTVFVGVPQIFAMIHRSIQEQISRLSWPIHPVVKAVEHTSFLSRRLTGTNIGASFFRILHQRFGPSLRVMISGGARLDPSIARDFYRWGFNLVQGYGLTETSPVVSFSVPNRPKFDSVGKALPGVEIKIDEPDDHGEGQVLVRGPNVMQGYYGLDHETQKVMRQGWFCTGDIGRLDAQGFLFLTGRSKEMLVLSNGENINPEELEQEYKRSLFIKEIAVLSVPEEYHPEVTHLAAIIVPDEDHFKKEKEVNLRKRLRWELENVSATLPTYKRINGFVISQESLPRTRLGKLQRFELESIYARLSQGGAHLPMKEETVYSQFSRQAIAFFEEHLRRPVSPGDHLELDLGLDSLGRLELFVAVQERLQLQLTDDQAFEFFSCDTIGKLLQKLKEVLEQQGGVAEALTYTGIERDALAYLEEKVGRRVSLDDHLELDLGLDSLSRMELLIGIQQQLGLKLDEQQSAHFFLCGKVEDLLYELRQVKGRAEKAGAPPVEWREILFQDPPAADMKKIYVGRMNIFSTLFNLLMLLIFKVLFKILFVFRIQGRANLPARGPYLICPNHNNYLDGLFVLCALPFRVALQTFFLGDSKFFSHWLLRPFQGVARLMPIQFTHRMADALRMCAYVLRKNKVLCYFPEGQRSIDGRVQEFRKGVGILVHELETNVVPVYIRGSFRVWPRGRKWPRLAPVMVCFGKVVSAKELAFKMTDSDDIYDRVAKNLRERVVGMSSSG